MRSAGRQLLLIAFTLSGFAGLIYESLWTHYLKLFLGHAAYAQTLVLVIFMGGLAAGSVLASRLSPRWTNLLRVYALAEAAIGVVALLFHPIFVAATNAALIEFFPALQSPAAVTISKWVLAGALILPQSVVLGMTFPLMAAGFIRAYPERPGGSLALLYFCNSVGGAVGVLVSGFYLIPTLGLPNTSNVAGLINLGLAAVVWVTAATPNPAPDGTVAVEDSSSDQRLAPYSLLIAVSALTGTASFVYEIGWTRMLSLVLGSSTQAFELMLSAFILGLALGGLWIKRRIDTLTNPIAFLGEIQIAMGALALSTLALYGWMFPLMRWLSDNLEKTDSGYVTMHLASDGIAMAIMLPATFFAGTTLPLITLALVRSRRGESSIGLVYGANTIGAIVGVLLAVHVGLPMLGLKYLVSAGAVLDMGLGIVLLSRAHEPRARTVALPLGAATMWLALILWGVQFDTLTLASGVFRFAQPPLAPTTQMLFYRDGKTATVAVTDDGGYVAIRTNGKVDASMSVIEQAPPAPDEPTQVLAGGLPLLIHPAARRAVNIGFGSGMTSHVLLSAPSLESVDTVEIEPAMVEGARGFYPRNKRAYDDRRSRIITDDAKTFFSTYNRQYDIIVSEPSNPWVAGTASLFSVEFYGLARRHLAPGGVFVQWLQAYEFDVHLVGSVLKALGHNFDDYALYAPTAADLLIVAVNGSRVPEPRMDTGSPPDLLAELRRVNINTLGDVTGRRIADKQLLQPWLATEPLPANSDYRPVLDDRANRARFLLANAFAIRDLALGILPVLDVLGHPYPSAQALDVTEAPTSPLLPQFVAQRLRDRLLNRPVNTTPGAAWATDRTPLREADALLERCRGAGTEPERTAAMITIGFYLARSLAVPELEAVWPPFESLPCFASSPEVARPWLRLFKGIGERNPGEMSAAATALLAADVPLSGQRDNLVGIALLGHIGAGNRDAARALWQTERGRGPMSFPLAVTAAHLSQ